MPISTLFAIPSFDVRAPVEGRADRGQHPSDPAAEAMRRHRQKYDGALGRQAKATALPGFDPVSPAIRPIDSEGKIISGTLKESNKMERSEDQMRSMAALWAY
ncbi:MAG: hypothetical protein AAF530_00895 [Pseudomonadota bacterium]